MISEKYKNIAIMLGAFVIFVLTFQVNFFNAASKGFFEGHQLDSESLVLGRMVETQNNGYMSHGGFLGHYLNKNIVNFQYEAYVNNKLPESNFVTYKQSFGLQGYFYASMDSVFRFVDIESRVTRLYLSKIVTSSLLAGLLVLFINLVVQNFGFFAATIATILLATSQWVVVFSNNLYWMFFLIILPFVVVSSFFQINAQNKNLLLSQRLYLLFILVFFAVFIKCLAGYEYISTILMTTVTPLIFYAIKDTWGFKLFSVRFVLVGLSGLAGFFAAILLHLIQLSSVLDSYSKGLDHLWVTIAKRTHGDPNTVNEVYRASLESNVFDVILKYWYGHAFNLDSLIGFGGIVTFGELILTLLTISSLITALTFSVKYFKKFKKLNLATVTALWFSILAPLSWHILAKGHSYIHGNMNHVLWYVPFLLIGFAYIGFAISIILSQLTNFSIKHRLITLGSLLSLLIIVHLVKIHKKNNEYRLFINDSYEGMELNSDRKLSNFYNKNQFVFVSERCDRNLSIRFFLHVIPQEIDDLPESRRQYNFDNLDFSWRIKESHSFTPYPFGQKSCIASIQLPSYPVKGIRTGQFNQDGRLWESYIDLTAKRFISDLQAFNLTDRNWVNGVSRSRSGFFIENTFANRQSLRIGDRLIFKHSGERVIEEITHSSRFINIFLSGEMLVPELDGYPHVINIKQKSSE